MSLIDQNITGVNTNSGANKSVLNTKSNSSNKVIANENNTNKPVSIEEGHIIRGEVIDLRNNEVTVKFNDNTIITAKLEGNAELTIGEDASFRVLNSSPKNLCLLALAKTQNHYQDITILKALEEANLPRTDRNNMIVRELLNNKMSIDKQTIMNLIKQSYLNKDISISTLVLMNKHKIPLTEANMEQFENYRNYEHRITNEVLTLSNTIPNVLEELANNNSPNFLNYNSQLLNLLASPNETYNVSIGSFLNSNELLSLTNILESVSTLEDLKPSILNGTASLRDVNMVVNNVLNIVDKMDSSQFLDLLANPTIKTVLDAFSNMQYDNNELGSFLKDSDRSSLLEQLKGLPLSVQIKNQILDGSITTSEFLNTLKTVLPFTGEEVMKNLGKSKEYHAIIKNKIITDWTISPNKLVKEDINDFYSKMQQQLSSFEQLASNSSPLTNLAHQSSGLNDNIDFMRTLNQMFPYVQIPLKLKDRNIHSDLYVYTKKRDLKNNKNNISVLLHLDMEYLGIMDIHLTLTNRQVNAKFYLETSDSKDLISLNTKRLEDSLLTKGYELHTEVYQREKEIDLVKDFIEQDIPSSSLKRFTFDIRA